MRTLSASISMPITPLFGTGSPAPNIIIFFKFNPNSDDNIAVYVNQKTFIVLENNMHLV